MPKNPKKARFAALYQKRFSTSAGQKGLHTTESEIIVDLENCNPKANIQNLDSTITKVTNKRIDYIGESAKQKIGENKNCEDPNYIIVNVESLNSLLGKAQCIECGCATLKITVSFTVLYMILVLQNSIFTQNDYFFIILPNNI